MPNGMASNCWCRITYLPSVVMCWHKLWAPCTPFSHLEGVWAMYTEYLVLWKGLFKLDIWGVKQDLITYVGQLVLPNVLVKEWITDPDIHGLLDCPCKVMRLPTHNTENVQPGMIICGIDIVLNGVRSPDMFLKAFPQRSLQTHLCPPHHTPVWHTYTYILLPFSVWRKPCLLESPGCFWRYYLPKVELDPHFTTNVCQTFTSTLCVGYHYMDVTVVAIVVVVHWPSHTICCRDTQH